VTVLVKQDIYNKQLNNGIFYKKRLNRPDTKDAISIRRKK